MFVRQDLPIAAQIVQTNHATFEMAYTLPQSADEVTPSIVLIGVPDTKALLKVIQKLKLNHIEFSEFHEDDDDMGLTAVATVPLSEEQRFALRGYKLWNEAQVYPCSSAVRASTSKEDEGRLFDSAHGYQRADSSTMQEA